MLISQRAFRYVRRAVSIAGHSGMVVLANAGAFWLRFDGDVPQEFVALGSRMLPWLLVIRLMTFVPLRLFEGLWKYTSLWDLRNILIAITTSSAAFYVLALSTAGSLQYPRSIYIIDAVLLVCMMTGIRLSRRLYTEVVKPQSGRRVLIYGAGDAGELVVREMRHNPKFDAIPVGFIDDDHRKAGHRIHGVPVLGNRSRLPQILRTHSPEELLIAMPSASRGSLREIVRALEPHQIRITTLPRLHDLLGARVDLAQIRQLKVEDLLARDPVGLDYGPVRLFLRNKRVLVTGAGGSIGSELCRQVVAAGPASLVLLDRYENGLFQIHRELFDRHSGVALMPLVADITDARRLDQVFLSWRPQVVFHAAAHKHVPLMEASPSEAIKNNVRGTRLVAEAAIRASVETFVLISTDKAVNPTSVMGASKRVAELIVESLGASRTTTRFATVRFGNVLASSGSVVPTFLDQIAKGGPVTVTHPEMKRFFMLIPEAVQLVLHAATLEDRAGLFTLDMGEQVKISDLARNMIRLSGYVPDRDIEVQFTGMRPGEKLAEELIDEGEHAEPALMGKILCLQTPPRTFAGFDQAIARLEALACDGSDLEVLRGLQTLLAEFVPEKLRTSPA